MRISAGKAAYAIIVLSGIVYAFVTLRGPNGLQGLIEKRQQVQRFEAGNDELRREIEQKQTRIERLQNDPQEQEIEIRQRLKLAAPGEKIYIIDDRKK